MYGMDPISLWDPLSPYGPRQLLARAHAGVKSGARSGKIQGDPRTKRQLCHIYIYMYIYIYIHIFLYRYTYIYLERQKEREREREKEREWTVNDL